LGCQAGLVLRVATLEREACDGKRQEIEEAADPEGGTIPYVHRQDDRDDGSQHGARPVDPPHPWDDFVHADAQDLDGQRKRHPHDKSKRHEGQDRHHDPQIFRIAHGMMEIGRQEDRIQECERKQAKQGAPYVNRGSMARKTGGIEAAQPGEKQHGCQRDGERIKRAA